ncbi:dienelactone hydrolase family protein [Nocardia sp. NPDC051833]|uniref:dienelactone hydrolase family protein n=1 Tax=Nocardia sp. NPDC051833 TaxID=3155674 RepID=UPI0034464ADA
MDRHTLISPDTGREAVVHGDSESRSAVVLCHEVFGLTDALGRLAETLCYATGATVYAPHLLLTDPYAPSEETAAYGRFMATLGPTGLSQRLLDYTERRRADHDRIYCLGLSVGATAAWIASADQRFDAVVPVYGSRIRDHTDVRPTCRVHAVFAEHEPSFDPNDLARRLRAIDNVTVEVLRHHHGFCSPDSPHFSQEGLDTIIGIARELFRN